jgi:ATPase AAA-2 domain protein
MNNGLIIYSYTSERLNEFKKQKQNNDIIVSTYDIASNNNNNSLSLITNENEVYVDITTLYRSSNENLLVIDNIISQVRIKSNWHIIINYNSLTRFKEDFGQYIDEVIPIQKIYNNSAESYFDFSSLTEQQINSLEENLNKKLYGHKEFKEEFINQIKNYSILYNLGEIKIMSLLICGDSGTGKTELARIIHETFFSGSNIIKINLGNYKTQGAINSLIGSPKGYYGSERGGELSNKIKNSDSKVILIDEFEKADTDIFNFFYELLEDGKFTDLNENEYDLNGYLIIFTTNLKEKNYKEVIPAPLLSRFTMKALFEPVGFEIKNKYIVEKAKALVEKYNDKYGKTIDYADVIKKIDKNVINSTKNFRYLNRLVQKALISTIENNE